MTERPLDELLADAPGLRVRRRAGDGSVLVRGITHRSAVAGPGDVFCCVRGSRVDGHDHAPEAVGRGAVALLLERPLGLGVPEVEVDDVRQAMGPLAASVFGHPSRAVPVIGVTGTNGKTTTTHLLGAVLDAAGRPAGVIGTLSGAHTTPEAPELQERLAAFVAEGRQAVAMEVSSHALALHRVAGTRFAVAVFTNLGRDHLDFHETQEQYFAAKARLFDPSLADEGVVCIDDPHGRLLADAASIPITPYSLADAEDLEVGPTTSAFRWRGEPVTLPMGGRFNVANAIAVATVASRLGLDEHVIAAGLSSAPPVPGRFEHVDAGQAFAVVVDYAHTPDSLGQVLAAARDAAHGGRVIVVFGCGGDRDHSKRPLMGAVAADLADVVVVTSDNPRSEDPPAIISEVLGGISPPDLARVWDIVDRRAAIETAVRAAAPGDVVVIAGKGHETTQTAGDTTVAFDDRVVARQAIEERLA
jgi:UDP-N-acetylmuramoyl-L-alanyl-D-glutamate--2,6-diaminopimelate ligase